MYINEYEIATVGTKYDGNKEKKNQVLTHVHSNDGIQLNELTRLIEAYDDTVHRHGSADVKITVTFNENQ
jgi:hypothetical protein